jgi:hypothetical protein
VKLFAALLLLIWAATPLSPEFQYFRYARAIERSAPEGRQTCVAVDPAIFPHAAPQLADLRLYRDATETPYAIQMSEPTPQNSRHVPLLNLGETKGHTVFDAAMPAGTYGDLELGIDGRDFLAAVTVTGRQMEAAGPAARLGSFTIFDLTRQKLGRSTVLHLPVSDFRYLHFQIDGNVKPSSVKGLAVPGNAGSEPKYIAVSATSTIRQQGPQTVIEFTLAAHTPVDRIAFVPGAQPANFSRDVEVRVFTDVGKRAESYELVQTWSSSGNLLRVHRVENGHAINEEHLSVPAPSGLTDEPTRWRIAIENGDDTPLDLKSVRTEMVRRDLCFDAAAGATYRLLYGDEAVSAPRYDYASLFKLQNDSAQASLGPEAPNPTYEPRPDSRPFTDRHPILLWVALGAVVLLLGAITLRTAKSTAVNDRS